MALSMKMSIWSSLLAISILAFLIMFIISRKPYIVSSKRLVHGFTGSTPFLSEIGSLAVMLTPLYLFFISTLLLFIYFFILTTFLLLATTCLLIVSLINFILSLLLKIWALTTTFLDLRPHLLVMDFFLISSNMCMIS